MKIVLEKSYTRLERMAKVVEDTIEKLLANADQGNKNIYLYRYNLWIGQFEKEVLHNISVDTARLRVSKFMEQLVSHYITRAQTVELIHSRYPGWRNNMDKVRKRKIDELYEL